MNVDKIAPILVKLRAQLKKTLLPMVLFYSQVGSSRENSGRRLQICKNNRMPKMETPTRGKGGRGMNSASFKTNRDIERGISALSTLSKSFKNNV